MNNKLPNKPLYLISPPCLDDDTLPRLKEVIASAAHLLCAFQLRLKGLSDDEVAAHAARIKPLLGDVPLIINDKPAIALSVGAAGVHLGAEDEEPAHARRVLGENALIGASAYDSLEAASRAQAAGADYVCFGAFFPSTTKRAKTHADTSLLRAWRQQSSLSCGAIGGITPARAADLLAAGADFVAMSAAVWQSPHWSKTLQALHHLTKQK